MKKIMLVGGGGHCHACIDVIEQTKAFSIIGIIDPKLTVGDDVCGYPILGGDEKLEELVTAINYALITVGQLYTPTIRIELYDKLRILGYQLPSIVSPLAYLAKDVVVGSGTIIMHGAIVNTKAKIGDNCILNTKSLVEHDAVIADHCHISTATTVNGGAVVEERSFLGSNAVIVQGVRVPNGSFIKANQIFLG